MARLLPKSIESDLIDFQIANSTPRKAAAEEKYLTASATRALKIHMLHHIVDEPTDLVLLMMDALIHCIYSYV